MHLNRRLLAVTRKEVKEIVRDKLYLTLAFGVPLILYILFGFGLTLDAKNIPFAVIDQNRSSLSRAFVDRLVHSKYFTLKEYLIDSGPLAEGLVNGRFRLGLIIPPQFDST
jgi:ABC-2 type transport system permease protein